MKQKSLQPDLEQRINRITRRVRTRKLGRLLTFHFPRKSDEYQMYKEEALKEEVPKEVYEATVQHEVAITLFYQDAKYFLGEKWNAEIVDISRHSNNLKYAIRWDKERLDNVDRMQRGEAYDHQVVSEYWSEDYEKIRKRIEVNEREKEQADAKYKNWERMEFAFKDILKQFPQFCREMNADNLLEDEKWRVTILDRIKEFRLDYQKILLNSLTATYDNLGNVASGIVDRLVKANYEPAVNYRARLKK